MASSRSGSLKVTGVAKAVRQLKAMGAEVEDLKDAFARIASEGATAVKRHVPRRSGRLAADVRGNRAQSKAVVTAGRASVPYAGPINYGWARRNIEPAGFMQAGDAETAPKALRMLEAEINNQIRKKDLS